MNPNVEFVKANWPESYGTLILGVAQPATDSEKESRNKTRAHRNKSNAQSLARYHAKKRK